MAEQAQTGNSEPKGTALDKPKPAIETLRDMLTKYRGNFAAVLPKHLTVDKLLQVALAAASRNPRLLQCHPTSILRSLMVAAQLGLDPSGVLGSGYLVPFWNTKTGRYEAQFIPGYRGLIDLARRSGEVTNVESHVVYDKDIFEFRLGLNPLLDHVPSLEEDPGKPKAAYCIVRLKDSPVPLIEVMSYTQIEAVRKRSKAASEGPWVTDWPEMARKTPTRRALKYAPLSPEAAKAMAVEDRFEAGEDIQDIVTLPAELEGEEEGGEKTGSKSDRLLSQLKQVKTTAATAEGKTAEAPAPTPPAPAGGPQEAPQDAAVLPGAVEAGTPVLPTVPVPTPEPVAGPGPGWPRTIINDFGSWTFAAPPEFEAWREQCPHPRVEANGVCARCGKEGLQPPALLQPQEPGQGRPRRSR